MMWKSIWPLLLLSSTSLAQNDLASVLTSQSDLTTLVDLASLIPGLISTLAMSSNITILAPTNAAFGALSDQTPEGMAVRTRNASAVLPLLFNHVIKGEYSSSIIPDRTPAFVHTMLNSSFSEGQFPYSNITGGQYIGVIKNGAGVDVISGDINVGKVTQADISGGNGIIIHKIDSVNRFGPTVQAYTGGVGATAFNQALQATRLDTITGDPHSLLNAGDLTIFVPNNQAFQRIGSVINTPNNNDALRAVLAYHVVPNHVLFSPGLFNTSIITLQGQVLTISVTPDGIFVNNAKVLLPNGNLFNGVAHVIDNVLNPANDHTVTEPNTDAASRVAFPSATPASLAIASLAAPTSTRYGTPTLLATLVPVEGAAAGIGDDAAAIRSTWMALLLPAIAVFAGALIIA